MCYFILIHLLFKIILPLDFEIQRIIAFLEVQLLVDYIFTVIFASMLSLNNISSKVKTKADITVSLNIESIHQEKNQNTQTHYHQQNNTMGHNSTKYEDHLSLSDCIFSKLFRTAISWMVFLAVVPDKICKPYGQTPSHLECSLLFLF